jgi:predicted nucleic acid-binding protein
MAVNYTVKAEVVDIRSDSPRRDDIFLVDTNVWYWLTYSSASTSPSSGKISWTSYQIKHYPKYLQKAISTQSLLAYMGLSLAELAHLIEKTEREIFIKSQGVIPAKEYRHNYPTERSKVISEVQAAWSQVKAIATPITLTLDQVTTDAALNRFSLQLLDGYDLFFLETMQKEGISQVITDDGDFVTVPGIKVFTANHNVINQAKNQGKFLVR